MSTDQVAGSQTSVVVDSTTAVSGGPEGHRLSLRVAISKTGPCNRHVTVTVPRVDIDFYTNEAVKDLISNAAVPGFRPGRVPRKLVVVKFKKEISDHIRQKILVDSLEQLASEHNLDAINEPDLAVGDLEIPDEGDFEYEFNVEVRPEFDLPEYKGLKLTRPMREIADADVEEHINRLLLEHFGTQTPVDRPAQSGDVLTVDLTVTHNGKSLAHQSGAIVVVRPTLAFQDAELTGFDSLMNGAKAGEERTGTATISVEAADIELRNEKVECHFVVKEVQERRAPERTPEFLETIGVKSVEDLQQNVRETLNRQLSYEQRQSARSQVLSKITESADWDLPDTLVRRQVENAMRREILELEQAGFTSEDIRSRENGLRQNAISVTRQALKEHFVLDKLATTEKIEVTPEEMETEIYMMAYQRGESPRRVRARLEKNGMIENLAAQILERKAIEFVLENGTYEDVPAPKLDSDTKATLDLALSQATVAPVAATA